MDNVERLAEKSKLSSGNECNGEERKQGKKKALFGSRTVNAKLICTISQVTTDWICNFRLRGTIHRC